MEPSTPVSRSPDQKLMALGPKTTLLIFIFYLAIFCVSGFLAFQRIQGSDPAGIQKALLFCIEMSLVGSTVFYSRKLYKACINNSYDFDGGKSVQVIGTFFFYILRPFFAVAFAWITHMIWEASIISSVDSFTAYSPTHLYLSGVLGFFVGFLAGRVLTRMEAVGEKHLNGVW